MLLLVDGRALLQVGLRGWPILRIHGATAILLLNTLLLFMIIELVETEVFTIANVPTTKGLLAHISGRLARSTF